MKSSKLILLGCLGASMLSLSAPSLADRLDVCERNDNPKKCNVVSVPEPGTLALLGFGLVGAAIARRKKNR